MAPASSRRSRRCAPTYWPAIFGCFIFYGSWPWKPMFSRTTRRSLCRALTRWMGRSKPSPNFFRSTPISSRRRPNETPRPQAENCKGTRSTPRSARYPRRSAWTSFSRLYDGDPLVGALLRRRVRESVAGRTRVEPNKARTVGELRTRAAEIAAARKRAAEAAVRAERERREAEAAEARKKRLAAMAMRGEHAWRVVENEIERRNAAGYDRATTLLADLRDVAASQGKTDEFERRFGALRQKHARKGQFIDRLRSLVKN